MGRAVSTAAERVQRHAVGMQVACRWGVVDMQRHADAVSAAAVGGAAACSPHAGCTHEGHAMSTAAAEGAAACRRGMQFSRHAGGMHVGRAVSTATEGGAATRSRHAGRVQWHAVGMQALCPSPPQRVQRACGRHAGAAAEAGAAACSRHAGWLCKLPQKRPNSISFRTNLGDGFAA